MVVVEEYIEGMTLADCLQQERMSVYTAVRIARDLLRILIDLHTRDVPIIHRDIKPSNVMLGNNDEVFLLDVNVAKNMHLINLKIQNYWGHYIMQLRSRLALDMERRRLKQIYMRSAYY